MLVVLQIVITVIAAAFYNVFAEIFGGVEITISEDDRGSTRSFDELEARSWPALLLSTALRGYSSVG